MMDARHLALAAALAVLCAAPADARQQPAANAVAAPAKPIVAEPLPPRVDATFRLWDKDRSGTLSLQEFRNGWGATRRGGALESRQRLQFDKVDANHDGAIDPGEYANLLLVKRAGKAAPALATFDANRNGRLEFVEYQDLIRRMAPRAPRRPASPTAAGAPASKGNTK